MLVSLVVIALLVGSVADAGHLTKKDFITPDDLDSALAIVRSLNIIESVVEGAGPMYNSNYNVDFKDLQLAWKLIHRKYGSQDALNALKNYSRSYSLAAAMLKVGEPTDDKKDTYMSSLYPAYRHIRLQKVPKYTNEETFEASKTGALVKALIGNGEIDNETVENAQSEFTNKLNFSFNTQQTYDQVFKDIETRCSYLGDVPATFLRLKMPFFAKIYDQLKKDADAFKKRFMDELAKANLQVQDGHIVCKN